MKQTFLWTTVLALLAAPATAATLSFAGSPRTVQVGDTFTMDVQVSGADDLYAFQFDIAFDPTVVQASGVLEGGFLAAPGAATAFIPGDIDNGAGTVSFTGGTRVGPPPGAAGDGVLVHLAFLARAEGSSTLSLGNVVLLDSALAEIGATAIAGGVQVTAVPEPAAPLLFGLGLAALAARRRLRA